MSMGRATWTSTFAVLALLCASIAVHAATQQSTAVVSPSTAQHLGNGTYVCVYTVPADWQQHNILSTEWAPFHSGVYADLGVTLQLFDGYIELNSQNTTSISFTTHASAVFGVTGCFSSVKAISSISTPPASATTCDGVWYKDEDGDGYTTTHNPQCTSPGPGYTKTPIQNLGSDCDDLDPTETIAQSWCADNDGDGWHSGQCQTSCKVLSRPLLQSQSKGEDCNDTNAQAQNIKKYIIDKDGDGYQHGLAVESCGAPSSNYTELQNFIGHDCDDQAAHITKKKSFCQDTDGDGYWSNTCNVQCTASPEYPQLKLMNMEDCDDTNPDAQMTKTFYFDSDGDGYVVQGSEQKACANALTNANGTWRAQDEFLHAGTINIQFDECDDDPAGHTKQPYFRDYDGDGIPYNNPDNIEILTAADIPFHEHAPTFTHTGTMTMPADPALQHGPGLLLAPPPVPTRADRRMRTQALVAHDHARTSRTTETPSSTIDPALLLHTEQKFCSDSAAAESGYAPPPENNQWDICDHDANFTQPQLFCFDNDADSYGDNEHKTSGYYCMSQAPDERFVSEDQCTDCDDTDDTILDTWTLFADHDNDGWGDHLQIISTECSHNTQDITAYEDGNYSKTINGEAWVANSSDIANYLPTASMESNFSESPGKIFLLVDKQNNYEQYCLYGNQGLECITPEILTELDVTKSFLPEHFQLPEVSVDALPPSITQGPFSFSSIISIIHPDKEKLVQFFAMNNQIFYTTHTKPLGPAIIATHGVDYRAGDTYTTQQIVTESKLATLTQLSPMTAAFLQPHITNRLIDFKYPIPVGILEEWSAPASTIESKQYAPESVTRRIIVEHCIGPELTIALPHPEEKFLGYTEGHLLVNPWIHIDIQSALQSGMFFCEDTDGDYLPDTIEQKLGTNASLKDSDGDGISDMMEYRYAGYDPFSATMNNVTIEMDHYADGNITIGLNNHIGTDADKAILTLAINKAISLLPAIITRLIYLHGDSPQLIINQNMNEFYTRLQNATLRHASEPYMNSKKFETIGKSFLTDGEFLVTRASILGSSEGCGINQQNMCIDLQAHTELTNGTLSLSGLTNTLLHEVLHHIILMTGDDPDDFEHKIIYDVLGKNVNELGGYSLD